jgi:hypothetical protein
MVELVSILDKALGAIGYMPVARGLASEALSSPWSNTDDLTRWTLDDLFGIDLTGVQVNRARAMRVATVAKARNVIASTVGRLPMYTAKDGRRAAVQNPLLARAERGVPFSTTMTWTIDALMFYPCTWWHVTERDAAGWPLWVEWIDRSRATLDTTGRLSAIDNKAVDPKNVIRFDSPLGTGLLDIARDTIARAITINKSASHAEENPIPSIDLHHIDGNASLTEEEIAKLVDGWRKARIRGGIGYTPKSIEARALGIQPEQLLIDARKQIQLELIRHLNFPAWAADVELGGSSLNYSNRASRNAELIDLACAPYISAIRDRLSMPDVTPRGWRVLFDTDELTRDDLKTRFETYSLGRKAGFLTNQQIADWEGWDTVPPEVAPTRDIAPAKNQEDAS